ncbi:MAG TPA: hypothetical protein VJ696_01965, partial [Rhodanobacteraceae bacterium]|nr:hypothetical protein [Rhodanobacteraceae bacterium]
MGISRPAALVLFVAMVPASAVELDVLIDDSRGQPVQDAVVSVRGDAGAVAPAAAPVTHIIDQRSETFIPYVEIFR